MLAKGDLKYRAIECACGKGIPLFGRKTGRSFRMDRPAETASRNFRSDWDVFSRRLWLRKLRPGICAQNGTRFPSESAGGKRIQESTLKTGCAFTGPSNAAPGSNLSHLYIDLNRFTEKSNSTSTCVFENLNSQ